VLCTTSGVLLVLVTASTIPSRSNAAPPKSPISPNLSEAPSWHQRVAGAVTRSYTSTVRRLPLPFHRRVALKPLCNHIAWEMGVRSPLAVCGMHPHCHGDVPGTVVGAIVHTSPIRWA